MEVQSKVVAGLLLASLLLKPAQAAPSFQQTGNTLVMSNADVLLEYNLNAGEEYYVLSSSNVAIPLADWTVLATNNFDTNGAFRFTNALIPGGGQRFYRIEMR